MAFLGVPLLVCRASALGGLTLHYGSAILSDKALREQGVTDSAVITYVYSPVARQGPCKGVNDRPKVGRCTV